METDTATVSRTAAPDSQFCDCGVAAALLAILPAFLGGATARWSEGAVLFLLGLFIGFWPPLHSPGRAFEAVAAGLLLCAAAAFLPASWVGIPAWRAAASNDFGIAPGPWVTPQPWRTAESIVLLAGGLAWLCQLCAAPVDRAAVLRLLCGGVSLLAATSLFLCRRKIAWPGGDSGFGPFPNKNQTGDLLAMGAILAMGCVHDDFSHRRKTWVLWACAAAVILAALVPANSRAAIALFFLGAGAWMLCVRAVRRPGFPLAAGAAILLILLAAFFLEGGILVKRFLPVDQGGEDLSADLRWSIQKDALRLAATSPWVGIGLGNFESEFWLFHRAVKGDVDVLHPESDWLWLAIEMGWPAAILALCGVGILAMRVFPLGADSGWQMRTAGAVCAAMFALHGALDVSGHRMGSAFPALLVLAMALNPPREPRAGAFRKWTFRAAALFFCVVGLAWLASGWTNGLAETPALSPWKMYYEKGVETAFSKGDFRSAIADFSRANYLNPVTPELPLDEGLVWLHIRPALALPAWQEALRRAGDSRAQMYARILAAAEEKPGASAGLREIANGSVDLSLVFLAYAGREEFSGVLADLLRRDPASFSAKQKQALFAICARRGDLRDLAARAESNPDWMKAGWIFVAEHYASTGNYERAFSVARPFIPSPAPPKEDSSETADELARDVYINPGDFRKGFSLCQREMQSGDSDSALRTAQRLTASDECPATLHLLEADLNARLGNWREAWMALENAVGKGELVKQ